MKKNFENFYILTGGPGVGKTTLLHSLNALGFITVPEDARKIIQQQMAVNGSSLPWKDKESYAQLMLRASINTYEEYNSKNTADVVFFDRGIPDAVCYMKMEKIPVAPHTDELINKYPYNKTVFMLPPWQEIYVKDTERRQNWKEALFTFEKMKETYAEYGYDIIEIPKGSAAERSRFILDFLKNNRT